MRSARIVRTTYRQPRSALFGSSFTGLLNLHRLGTPNPRLVRKRAFHCCKKGRVGTANRPGSGGLRLRPAMQLRCSLPCGNEIVSPGVGAQVVGSAAMRSGVTCRAERNQVLLGVGSRMAAELPVVHFKIRHRATRLTPPTIATQDLLAQTFVRQRVQPRGTAPGRIILRTPSHAGFRGTPAAVRRARTCSSVRSSGAGFPGRHCPSVLQPRSRHRSSPGSSPSICPCPA